MSYLKIPLARTLPALIQTIVQQQIDRLGKALPGTVKTVSGSIVGVNFEVQGDNGLPLTLPVVEMPLFGPEYIRYPVQVGDKGVCFPCDVYLGQMSGLGTGSAVMRREPNIANLVFFPIGNKNWSAVDTQAVTIYGPNGVVLRDTNSTSTLTLNPDSYTGNFGGTVSFTAQTSITFTVGGHSIVINNTGITIDGVQFLTHIHSGVTTGAGDTGPVVP